MVLLMLVSCSDDDHPSLVGHTKLRATLNGQPFDSYNQNTFAKVDEEGLFKEIFIHAKDTALNLSMDIKITIDRTGLGSYNFQGSLESSDAYIFINDHLFDAPIPEYYAPYVGRNNVGTLTISRNNGNRITGEIEVIAYDTETGLEQIRLEDGIFNLVY